MAGGVFGFLIFAFLVLEVFWVGTVVSWKMASLEEISTLKNRGCQENTLRTKRQILTTVIGMSWWTNCYVKLHRSEDVMVD